MSRRATQYSLHALFVFLTAINVVLGYIQFVGIWRFVLALGPPLIIAATINWMMSSDELMIRRESKEYQEREKQFPAAARVLVSLVIGLLIWLPILLVLTLTQNP